MSPRDDLLDRVAATGVLEAGRPVVVMLSGGRDSVALLAIAAELARGGVSALHCNYGLRRSASDADEAFCVAFCAELGVELHVERPRKPEGAGNVHAWARGARYEAGEALAHGGGALLAAGHTATDQAETVLYRLATSPGRRALLGMPARSGALVRPLLAAGATREETASWCTARGFAWREDAANDDDAYARARVRNGLVPALRAVDARAEQAVLQTAELLREESEALDEVVGDLLSDRDGEGVPVDRIASAGPGLARLALRRIAEDATGRSCPRAGRRLGDVLALGGDGALDVGDGVRIVVSGGRVSARSTPVLDRS